MVRVRKLGRRRTPGGGLRGFLWSLLSQNARERRRQLSAFLYVSFALLVLIAGLALAVHRKLERVFGAVPVRVVEGLLGALVVGLAWQVFKSYGAQQAQYGLEDMELNLPEPEVERRLVSGLLAPEDLVFESGCWTMLLASALFGEAAEVPHRRARRQAQTLLGVTIALGTVIVVAFVTLVLNAHEFEMWLEK